MRKGGQLSENIAHSKILGKTRTKGSGIGEAI